MKNFTSIRTNSGTAEKESDRIDVLEIVPAMQLHWKPLFRILPTIAFCALAPSLTCRGASELRGIDDPVHGYWTKTPRNRFTQLQEDLESGKKTLDTTSDLALLRSILASLEVPESSQMLVYSVTSLQKALISPRRPRALYFNDDTYVGFVPGGRVEVISLDPDLGGIFYIYDRLRPGSKPGFQRSEDCMSCHAPHHMEETPGLVIESVVPGITGGGEKAFRRERSGHDIPFEDRFGGWHLTGADGFPQKWANVMMEYTADGRKERTLRMGELFDISKYLRPTSDLLPQLLHEHQVGFVNRAIQAQYRTRKLLQSSGETDAAILEFDHLAHGLVRYLLFADEVPLPVTGVTGEDDYKTAFTGVGPRTAGGRSLRELNLRSRMLQNRCSYMIYSPSFTGLPAPLKSRVFAKLEQALADAPDPEFAYLPLEERRAIRGIVRETVADLPVSWGSVGTTALK